MKTQNYQMFRFMPNNRKLNEGLVKRLIKSIKTLGYLDGKPIIVTPDMVVIDGQHRLEACKRLGIDVPYSISNVCPNEAMIHLNMNQQIWRLEDYIYSWAESGKQVYKELLAFEAKHKLGTSNNLTIFRQGTRNADDVRKGLEFKANPKANEIANFILECKEYLPYYSNKTFVQSIVILFRECNDKEINKVKSKIFGVKQQAKVVDYLCIYENILNKYNKNGNNKKLI
jgi:hypothetical protein